MNPIVQYAGRVQAHLLADPRVRNIFLSIRHPPGSNRAIACLSVSRKDGGDNFSVEITADDGGTAPEDKASQIAQAMPKPPPPAKAKAKPKAKKAPAKPAAKAKGKK